MKSIFCVAVLLVAIGGHAQTPTSGDLTAAQSKLSADLTAVQAGGANLAMALITLYQDAENLNQIAMALNAQAMQNLQSQIDELRRHLEALFPFRDLAVADSTLTFTTSKPLNVWVNYGVGTAPAVSRTGCAFKGTLSPQGAVLAVPTDTSFSFTLPVAHGCLQVQGRDANGKEYDDALTF